MRSKHATPKKPPAILFCKNKYGPMTKVEHWQYKHEVDPKDNHVYRDGLSNMLSTYNRLGNADIGTSMTETRHMLAQIYTKTDPKYSFKPLVNFTSYPCTDTPSRNKLMKLADLVQLPPDFGVMDYITTQQDDYRNPYPSVTKPLTMSSPPPLLNRIVRSHLTQNGGTAPPRGFYQCLDTHTPIGHIRQIRLKRHQSFNPGSGLQDFPNIPLEILADKPKEIQV